MVPALINLLGIRQAAIVSNVFTVGKLVPIIIFIAAGLFFLNPQAYTNLDQVRRPARFRNRCCCLFMHLQDLRWRRFRPVKCAIHSGVCRGVADCDPRRRDSLHHDSGGLCGNVAGPRAIAKTARRCRVAVSWCGRGCNHLRGRDRFDHRQPYSAAVGVTASVCDGGTKTTARVRRQHASGSSLRPMCRS